MTVPACPPNITSRGRRRRRALGVASGVVALLMLVAVVVRRDPISVRLLVFVPTFVSALGMLQAQRGTCVARAMEGRTERDGAPAMAADAAAVKASRRVATVVVRDAAFIGLAGAAVAAALPNVIS